MRRRMEQIRIGNGHTPFPQWGHMAPISKSLRDQYVWVVEEKGGPPSYTYGTEPENNRWKQRFVSGFVPHV